MTGPAFSKQKNPGSVNSVVHTLGYLPLTNTTRIITCLVGDSCYHLPLLLGGPASQWIN